MLDRRFSLWLAALVVAACDGETAPPPLIDPDDPADTDHDSDEPHGDTGDLPDQRPLCLDAATRPPIADDLLVWAEALKESTNRFYGEYEWRALEDLGEDSLGPTPERVVMNRISRAWHRLKFGDLDGAISDLEKAEVMADASAPSWRPRARQLLGVAWMRRAETVNCLNDPKASSCIIPFDEHGVHADVVGMQNAGDAFLRLLEQDNPTADSTRWLLNVSWMARGEWPDGVPEGWALPTDVLASETPFPAWHNHAPGLRINQLALAGNSMLDDVDGDGRLDVMLSAFNPLGTMQLYLNMGNGWFCDASDASGVSAIPSVLGFSQADYDNDGDLDIAAPRGAWMGIDGRVRDSLLRNDGEGRFTDVAVAAGITGPDVDGPTQVAAWADYDGDGWLDLFIGREDMETVISARYPSSLYHNNGDGTFTDVARAAGVSSSGFVKGASWFDYDNDGDPDLYVSSLRGLDRLFRNNGDGTFTDRAVALGVLDPVKSFPSVPLDYDQDGRLDLFVAAFTNNYGGGGPLDPVYFQSAESFVDSMLGNPIDPAFSETAHLYHNTPDGFVDVTEEMGLDDVHATMGLSVGDMNGDGYPDLYLATGAPEFDALEPNVAYLNDRGARFLNITTDMRTGNIQKGHGVAFGDVDEDGDEDLSVSMGGAFIGDVALSSLYINPLNAGETVTRHAVTLRLQGVRSNRSAIGARVTVVTPEREFHHLVGQTGSFGANSLQVEVGLDASTTVSRVEIVWPGGALEVLDTVPVDHIVSVREGDGVVASTPFAPISLKGAGDGGHGG
jgi:hypothetical protein